uniref:sirohydrochlorin cobaltochelatase n=1 Tax=Salmonella enterica TaxID=28901 RepID=UPI00398C3A51
LIDSLRDAGVTGVHLMPLMLVAGDHAITAIASDDCHSRQPPFNPVGLPATSFPPGLAINPPITPLFRPHFPSSLPLAAQHRPHVRLLHPLL